MTFLKYAGLFVLVIALALGFSALVAWLLSLGIAFVTGYEIGFFKTWVGMFVLSLLSQVTFSGINLRVRSGD